MFAARTVSLALRNFSRVMRTISRSTVLHCSALHPPKCLHTPKLDAVLRVPGTACIGSVPIRSARSRYRQQTDPHCSFVNDAKRRSRRAPQLHWARPPRRWPPDHSTWRWKARGGPARFWQRAETSGPFPDAFPGRPTGLPTDQ